MLKITKKYLKMEKENKYKLTKKTKKIGDLIKDEK